MKVAKVNHIAIATDDLKKSLALFEALGIFPLKVEDLPERGIRTTFLQIGELKIELIEALHESSEISNFLKKRGSGIHHIALECDELPQTLANLSEKGIELLNKTPQNGANHMKVAFVHPKSANGVLVELCSKK